MDCDLNGLDSVEFLVKDGLVTHIPCPSYEAWDYAMQWLLRNAQPGVDLVVIDTISQLAFITQGDAKLGNDQYANLWEKRGLFLDGDANYLNVYQVSGYFIVRRIKNLTGRGVRVIFTCHEGDQTDNYIKKKAPSVNPALYARIKEITSDVFRLWALPQPVVEQATGRVLYAAGTRAIQIKGDAAAVAKYHMTPFLATSTPTHIPIPNATDPALPLVELIIGRLPSALCLYGEPGVGKTTTALSEALFVYLQRHHQDLIPESLKAIAQQRQGQLR